MCLEIRPNGSSNRRALLICIFTLVLLTGCIGIIFAYLGAWLVLPFAGLEALLLLVGTGIATLRSRRVEVLAISNDYIHLTVWKSHHANVQSFAKHWTQVKFVPGRTRHEPYILLLSNQGKVHQIGCDLPESVKRNLYLQLSNCLN